MEKIDHDILRRSWDANVKLGPLARFWLQRHDGFRQLGQVIEQTSALPAVSEADWQAKAQQLVGQLSQYLSHLHGHHNIEDHHFFPVFRRLEPQQAVAFDKLDADHGDIGVAMEILVGLSQQLGPDNGFDLRSAALAQMSEVGVDLVGAVNKHLDIEEGIVIPIILEHGEDALS